MGLYHLEENNNYRYGIWKIEEDENTLREILGLPILVPYTNISKRIEFLAVRVLAKTMGIDPLLITYLPSGKPQIDGITLNISISHTKGYAALLLSDRNFVGIDIERRSERIRKVRNKFMHREEEERIALQAGDESTALLLHWCAKESLFKAFPDEGVDFMKELRILDFTCPSEKGNFKAKALRNGMECQVDYRIDKDFVLTCCFSTESR